MSVDITITNHSQNPIRVDYRPEGGIDTHVPNSDEMRANFESQEIAGHTGARFVKVEIVGIKQLGDQ